MTFRRAIVVAAISAIHSLPLAINAFVPVPSNIHEVQSTTKIGFRNGVDTGEVEVDKAATVQAVSAPSKEFIRRSFESFNWEHQGMLYKINYRVEGPKDGPPILLIHGFGASLAHFRHQFRDFTNAGYRVYAMDLLGFGASDKPANVDYSIDLFADLAGDFVNAMDEQGTGKRWVIAGNSIGGLCSLAAGKRLKDRVRGVILLNCAPGMSVFRYEDVPLLVRPVLFLFQNVILGPHLGGYFFSRFKSRENVEAILKTTGVYKDTSNVDEELVESFLQPGNDNGSETVFLKVFGGKPGPTPESILPSLACPVLGIWGGADPWLSADKGKHPATEFHKYMKTPGSFQLQILPDVGHCPHDESPDEVNSRILSWLEKLPHGHS